MAKKTTAKRTATKKTTVRDLRPAKAGKVKGGVGSVPAKQWKF